MWCLFAGSSLSSLSALRETIHASRSFLSCGDFKLWYNEHIYSVAGKFRWQRDLRVWLCIDEKHRVQGFCSLLWQFCMLTHVVKSSFGNGRSILLARWDYLRLMLIAIETEWSTYTGVYRGFHSSPSVHLEPVPLSDFNFEFFEPH